MPKIKRSSYCGNSPKNKFVEDLAIAMALGDEPRLRSYLTYDAIWRQNSNKPIIGIEGILTSARKLSGVTEVFVEHVLTHGRTGAANGTWATASRTRGYCHMFEFRNTTAKEVKSITTYSFWMK